MISWGIFDLVKQRFVNSLTRTQKLIKKTCKLLQIVKKLERFGSFSFVIKIKNGAYQSSS